MTSSLPRQVAPKRGADDEAQVVPSIPPALLTLTGTPEPLPLFIDPVSFPGLLLLTGEPAAGKSMVAAGFSVAYTVGQEWMDRAFKDVPPLGRRRALYIDAENGSRRSSVRFRALGLTETIARERFVYIDAAAEGVTFTGTDPEGHPWTERLESTIREHRPQLVVIDTLMALAGALDVMDNVLVAQFMAWLRYLMAKYECLIVLLHHHRKKQPGERGGGQAALGAGQLTAQTDVHLIVESGAEDRVDADDGSYTRSLAGKLEWFKVRDGSPPRYFEGFEVYSLVSAEGVVESTTVEPADLPERARTERHRELREHVLSVLRSALPDSLQRAEVGRRVGMDNGGRSTSLKNVLHDLKHGGEAEQVGGTGGLWRATTQGPKEPAL